MCAWQIFLFKEKIHILSKIFPNLWKNFWRKEIFSSHLTCVWKLFSFMKKIYIVWKIFLNFCQTFQSKWHFCSLSKTLTGVWKLFILIKQFHIVRKLFQNFWKTFQTKWIFSRLYKKNLFFSPLFNSKDYLVLFWKSFWTGKNVPCRNASLLPMFLSVCSHWTERIVIQNVNQYWPTRNVLLI